MDKVFINNDWKFAPEFSGDMVSQGYDDHEMLTVRLPHTVKETPFHYFDESIYQMVSTYRKELTLDENWLGKRVFLTIGAAAHEAELHVNGEKVLTHSCGYTSFTAELTNLLDWSEGAKNVIAIRCDSRESLNVPPFGHVVDYMTYGGLYREAWLEILPMDYIRNVYPMKSMNIDGENVTFQPEVTISVGAEKNIEDESLVEPFDMLCDGDSFDLPGLSICQSLLTIEGELIAEFPKNELLHTVSNVKLWSPEHPNRYLLRTVLYKGNVEIDRIDVKMAFRTAEFRKDGFYLNHKKYKLRGLNRHQSYPYVGYAMPESMQRQDARILKEELGCNIVRTSHYPQSHDFVDECDRLGLLVFMEFPGWQHIGDDAWKEQALVNEREMILQYRNHPSIIIWGIRINESDDDDAFYEKTNALARELDPARQTGGVRAMKKGHLLEDVYTYNDFQHDGKAGGCAPKKNVTSDMEKGYLITEFNGHMYPTKSYDWEEHRLQHALRHANVLDAVAKEEDIAGCIGWCMFDYNTHKDFGSGDRICYHGVMDMFRNPKLAALIYACEQDETPVLELSSTMDIGEHPGCNRGATYIFTNADSVRMYKNDVFIKEFSAKNSPYTHLKHGPILIDDYIGEEIHKNEPFKKHQADIIKEALNFVALHGYQYPPRIVGIALTCMLRYHMKPIEAVVLYNKYIGDWGGSSKGYRFEAIKDGKVVKTIVKQPMTKRHLQVTKSADCLTETRTYDVCELRIQMQDENNNTLYFCNDPIVVKTEGPVEVIGPGVVGLQGGMTGVYLKSLGTEGIAKVIISAEDAEDVILEIPVNIRR